MKEATIIFPTQLFPSHPGLSKKRQVFLVEDQLFFSDSRQNISFHKKKLLLHRASMRAYRDKLLSQGYSIQYIEFCPEHRMTSLIENLKKKNISRLSIADVVDTRLEKRLAKQAAAENIKIDWLPTPGFLTPKDWFADYFKGSQHYSQNKFYIEQRKRLKILIEDGKPVGGKWSYDPENRKKIPKGWRIPGVKASPPSKYVQDARVYVEKYFPTHPGTTDNFLYPVTRKDAKAWLQDFLKNRLEFFGDYEDAMVQDQHFLFHSVLTPALNIGLITPKDIIDQTLFFAKNHPFRLNSLEGFIRQIIGWREFIRIIYVLEHQKERETNFWGHKKRIPESFYTGTTKILPVDTVIRRLKKHGYAHHIERLMILGNFMLLCEIDPVDVYRWFMEFFIDSYDWVMVPNVFGMSQYADGGLITTKPYISSSAYIRRMSDFPQGDWCEIWDALYWRFINKHRDLFAGNPRMKVMTYQLNRMGRDRLDSYLGKAEGFLAELS